MEGDENDDILSFWRQYKQTFPLIASVARDILAIPASNTSVERQFSTCKNTVTDKRTKLGSEKLNKLIFLKKNMSIFKENFAVSDTKPSGSLNAKRKFDTIILNDEPIEKKNKQNGLFDNENDLFDNESDLFDNENESQCFVNIESEEVEDIF